MANPFESIEGLMPTRVLVSNWDKPRLLEALREQNIQLNRAAEDLFTDCRFKPTKVAKVIGIKALSVLDLGFPSGATYQQLMERALQSGLIECPLELGPYLRLQFLNQPEIPIDRPAAKGRAPHGAITIASKPLDEADRTPKGFYLRKLDGILWLRGYWSGVEHIWCREDVLVFSRCEGAP